MPTRVRQSPRPKQAELRRHDRHRLGQVPLLLCAHCRLDGAHVHTTNTSNLPVEALEIEYPLVLMRYELVADSGSVGRYRGSMGLRRVYLATHDCHVRVDLTRQLSQSWGLFGGGPRAHGKVEGGPGVVFDGDQAVVKAGQWFALVTPGAGGYGPPAERSADAVARDIAEGVITPEASHQAYGHSP